MINEVFQADDCLVVDIMDKYVDKVAVCGVVGLINDNGGGRIF